MISSKPFVISLYIGVIPTAQLKKDLKLLVISLYIGVIPTAQLKKRSEAIGRFPVHRGYSLITFQSHSPRYGRFPVHRGYSIQNGLQILTALVVSLYIGVIPFVR